MSMSLATLNTRHTAERLALLTAAYPSRRLTGGAALLPPARMILAPPGYSGGFACDLFFLPGSDRRALPTRAADAGRRGLRLSNDRTGPELYVPPIVGGQPAPFGGDAAATFYSGCWVMAVARRHPTRSWPWGEAVSLLKVLDDERLELMEPALAA